MYSCETISLSRSSSTDINHATYHHGHNFNNRDIKNNKRRRIDYFASSTVKSIEVVCEHPIFISRQCSWCGRMADEDVSLVPAFDSAIPLDYLIQDPRLSKIEIAETKYEHTKNLLRQRKLYLVLDLDHTLLHSVPIKKMDLDNTSDSPEHELYNVCSCRKMTKLRPFVRTFLEEASTLFEMYIYTMGKRRYAKAMAGLLDPKGVYFRSRLIAREDCTKPCQKGLDVVLGKESAVFIVNDTESIWPDSKENLITLGKYDYFSSKNGDDESNGTLESVLEVLKKTHSEFFMKYDHAKVIMETDVRKVLKVVRDGCKP